eukprot:GHVL01010766.1.p1 GENE.GHVL01010766.1~~GHVL01010766.1.p1  ORF type:complete len:301 (+),score=32.34 GHVL01010766.1:36-938(+)
MLCELSKNVSFWSLWAILSGLASLAVMLISTSVFYYYFCCPTYEKWRTKTLPAYPLPSRVRDEIIQTFVGLGMSCINPALALYLTNINIAKGFCGLKYSIYYIIITSIIYFFFLDFFEFIYHYYCHVSKYLWKRHKYHHTFSNPSAYAVIADDYIDQFVRASPMFFVPLLIPMNLDVLFIQMAVFSYLYGCYLHCGHEFDWPNAHHPWINTSYQHCWHHATSYYKKPHYCGFVLKIFDKIFNSVDKKECRCAACCRSKGERSVELWEKVVKPDYSILFSPVFWYEGILDFRKSMNNMAKG